VKENKKKISGYRSIVGGLCIAEQNNVNYLEIGTKRWKCQVLAQKKRDPRGAFLFVKNISSSSRLGCRVHSISTHTATAGQHRQSLNRDEQQVIRCCPKMGSIFFIYLE